MSTFLIPNILLEEPFGDFMLLHLPMLMPMQIRKHLMMPMFRNLQQLILAS
jgi:hypothetical protein